MKIGEHVKILDWSYAKELVNGTLRTANGPRPDTYRIIAFGEFPATPHPITMAPRTCDVMLVSIADSSNIVFSNVRFLVSSIERHIHDTLKMIYDSRYDPEVAHSLEDDLYYDFVKFITESCDDKIKELAKLVLTSRDIKFGRRCS